MAFIWSRAHLTAMREDPATFAPLITDDLATKMLPGYDVWDLWPIRLPDGHIAEIGGHEHWIALSAPAVGSPHARHDVARLRLTRQEGERWLDLGPLFPDGASPGSREWAGSAVYEPDSSTLTVFYTAAGYRGESRRTFAQRLMQASAHVDRNAEIHLAQWTEHRESVVASGEHYLRVVQEDGEPGFIKAFRDPFRFHDPATNRDYLLFTASLADAETEFNGAIGVAEAPRGHFDEWHLLAPLVTADGVNNELERPHVVMHDGLYYVFFSTQRRTFHPDVTGPTGLYGFVGSSLFGELEPLNGSGLVLRNPKEEPYQAYSWLVLNDLRAVSFVDAHSLLGREPHEVDADGDDAVRRHFGGTMAPVLTLGLEGSRAWIEGVVDGFEGDTTAADETVSKQTGG